MGFVLSQAVLEIRYRRGMVFFDKCGSTMDALEDALEGDGLTGGEPPGMKYGELTSPADRLVVRYGPKSMLVMQHWLERPVRIEVVAPKVWAVVSETLAVKRKVVRAGFRLMFQWPIEGPAQATRALEESGLFKSSDAWTEIFGKPEAMHLATVSGSRRSELTLVRQDAGHDAEIRKLAAPAAMQLDIDIAHPNCARPFAMFPEDERAFTLTAPQLKDFLRDAWEQSSDIAKSFERLIKIGSHG